MTYTHFTIYASFNGPFPQAEVSRLIARHFDGATITFAKGLWQGEWEHSFQVHIILTGIAVDAVEFPPMIELAESLREHLDQSEVWIEQYQTTVTKVTA